MQYLQEMAAKMTVCMNEQRLDAPPVDRTQETLIQCSPMAFINADTGVLGQLVAGHLIDEVIKTVQSLLFLIWSSLKRGCWRPSTQRQFL
ncbi:MAG: hypothetical protein B7Y58_09660 [Halothiobacillus sp. 35-54-62]|nr:MAG: hypothetical protein B7Y58_09660 [Halothiobacillus sp. 35-54-62]